MRKINVNTNLTGLKVLLSLSRKIDWKIMSKKLKLHKIIEELSVSLGTESWKDRKNYLSHLRAWNIHKRDIFSNQMTIPKSALTSSSKLICSKPI